MKHLIKKDLFRLLSYILPVFLILCLIFLIAGDIITERSYHVWIIYMFILVAGGISTLEKYEEKQGGYHFLARLPISDREIVMAKFLLLLIMVLILTGFNLILSFSSLAPRHFSRIIRLVMFIFGWAYLIGIGLIYIAIFKKGFTRAITMVWVTFIVGLILFIFLLPTVLGLFSLNISQLISLALNMHPIYWIFISILSLVVYYQLMKIAVRVKTKARLNEVN